MEEIVKYKQDVIAAMLAATDDDGQPLLTEPEAKALLADLGDAPLIDGMQFNSAEETAQFLLEEL